MAAIEMAGELEKYEISMDGLSYRQTYENVLKLLGYPVGIDFETMMPIYFIPRHNKVVCPVGDWNSHSADRIKEELIEVLSDTTLMRSFVAQSQGL